jgi:uncharacterized protein (TIGR03437 family)
LRKFLVVCIAGALGGLLTAQTVPSFNITTVVGNATAGFSGDGGSPTGAELNLPFGITIANGNLYIADQVNQRVRWVTSGNINTLAGVGTTGYSGDGATALKANLFGPSGVAVDKNNNLYIADTQNNVIRMVTSGGQISTFAGNDTNGAGYSGDGNSAVNGQMAAPVGMTFDSKGNLYICDSGNNVIRAVTAGIFSTVVGNHVPDFNGDGGPAIHAELNNPEAMAFDLAGNIYIADTLNHRIRKVTTDGNIATIAGNGTPGRAGDGGQAINAQLNQPRGVAVDTAGNVYIADSFNNVIRVVLPTGQIATVAGTGGAGYGGDSGPATAAQLHFPTAIALDSSGNLFVADTDNSVIRELTPAPAQPAGLPPSINPGGVTTLSAYGGSAAIAPGTWVEIHGTNLAAGSRIWSGGDFNGTTAPTSLDGTHVHIGVQPAFVEFIGLSQVNALIPSTIGSGPQQLTVTTGSGQSAPYQITVNTLQPGLLAPSTFNIGGKQYVVAIFPDGTYALPPGSIPGVTSRAANPGETVVMYGIGFGPVTPNTPAGQIASGTPKIELPIHFMFGQTPASTFYTGLAPGAVGLYQFNVTVPVTAPSDAMPLTFTLGPVTGSQTLYIPVL